MGFWDILGCEVGCEEGRFCGEKTREGLKVRERVSEVKIREG